MRERLVAAVRHRDQTRDEELDDLALVGPRLAAGKTTTADVRNRPRREVVVRTCEVVVVDRGDPLVLGAQLVEIARAVEAVEVDPPIGDG